MYDLNRFVPSHDHAPLLFSGENLVKALEYDLAWGRPTGMAHLPRFQHLKNGDWAEGVNVVAYAGRYYTLDCHVVAVMRLITAMQSLFIRHYSKVLTDGCDIACEYGRESAELLIYVHDAVDYASCDKGNAELGDKLALTADLMFMIAEVANLARECEEAFDKQ